MWSEAKDYIREATNIEQCDAYETELNELLELVKNRRTEIQETLSLIDITMFRLLKRNIAGSSDRVELLLTLQDLNLLVLDVKTRLEVAK